jgi:hypothetical protein
MKKDLAIQAAELGLKPAKIDANTTLAEAVKSHDKTYWEAFPLMLATAAEKGELDLQRAENLLNEQERRLLGVLVMASLGLFEHLQAGFGWRAKLAAKYPARMVTAFAARFMAKGQLEVGGIKLAATDIKETFLTRFRGAETASDRLRRKMRSVFTARQAEIALKKLDGARLGKTEAEYYSRVIRKKAAALADEELHAAARRLIAGK